MEASFEAIGMDGLVFGDRPSILVSRCLLGIPCRYHGLEFVKSTGRHIGRPALIAKLRQKYELLDICPEVDAGLPTPRPPISLKRGHAFCKGEDITEQLGQVPTSV